MIKYNLKCENNHQFESWFNSSTDFDRLEEKMLLTCAVCGHANVSKELMAPSVAGMKKHENVDLATAIKTAKDQLKGAKNVGWQFAKEARAIHYGDKEEAQIYGRTEPAEAIELLKEGINIAPLPFDPDAKEN